jgi:hypothetical protein
MKKLSVLSQIFLGLLISTLLVWILRGVTILAFVPGIFLWALILLTIGFGVITSLQRIR